MDSLSSSVVRHKISQTEFDELYIATLDRDINNQAAIFDLPRLLQDNNFLLDLSGLNLRHRNFRHTLFAGINLDYTDLRGTVCRYADFTQVNCEKIIIDINSQFHGAKLSKEQLLSLQAHTTEKSAYIDNLGLANILIEASDDSEEWSFA